MQYVGKVGDYVYNQWNSLNPATLSGAIDIIVIEQPDGLFHCSPWHVRFGKFQIIKPLQKKIDLYVNDIKTDLPMKLGEGGEAFFVFATDSEDLSLLVVTSPVVSAELSPVGSPHSSAPGSPRASLLDLNKNEPEVLDLNSPANNDIELKIALDKTTPPPRSATSRSDTPTLILKLAFEEAKKITQKLNIPSKIDINGDMVLDMDGYKPNSQKNIDESDELVQKVFLREMNNLLNGKVYPVGGDDADNNEFSLLQGVISKDEDGKIRIVNQAGEDSAFENDLASTDNLSLSSDEVNSNQVNQAPSTLIDHKDRDQTYFKTLRLTSEQLRMMKLNYGRNKLKFKLNQGNSQVVSDLYLWKSTTPIVISDIDGTITKSDALGHVLNMIGKDWTHPGVAKLFQDIARNGYNLVYLTARSVGQADTTRQYLDSIIQDGVKLPKGPVILSPDRTMAALKREIILKKPEVFKMACLRDISSLYFAKTGHINDDDERTPFYAGFGNRITDAISYRSVKIPSHRIFTINPNGEVHMELLELAGYRSSYLRIGELVDQFFPPLKLISDVNPYWNQDQFDQYIHAKDGAELAQSPGSPRSISSFDVVKPDEKFTDLNYWREPMANLSDFSDLEDDEAEPASLKSSPNLPKIGTTPTPGLPEIYSVRSADLERNRSQTQSPKKERPISASFTSPLKNFMMFSSGNGESRKRGEDEEEDDDFTDDDYDDDYTDDYDDEDDEDDEDAEDEDEDEADEVGEDDDDDGDGNEVDEEDIDAEEDLDLDDGLTTPQPSAVVDDKHKQPTPATPSSRPADEEVKIITAREMLEQMDLKKEEQKS